jgi:hypothetical protein
MNRSCSNLKYFAVAKEKEKKKESYVVKLQHNFNLDTSLLFTNILKPYNFYKLFLKKCR